MSYSFMQIVADENMPYAQEWFGPLGTVCMLPGRALNAELLREADALLVRSVTRVDRRLLQGTGVRFVGSATSGTEHLDTDYLQAQGIAYASAPGCNAVAVVEYVLSCISTLDGVLDRLLATGGVVGIIGLGNVGSRLARRLQALDIRCVGYDPFLAAESALPLRDLDTVLSADVVCCHAPLTTARSHPTRHMLDARRLRQLRRGAVLINAGRGAVVDNTALLEVLSERPDLRVVLDVWENEPAIDLALLNSVALATPHVAGYSWDGKVAGTRAVLAAFCQYFQLSLSVPTFSESQSTLHLTPQENSVDLLRASLQSVYDVRRDDRLMRAALQECETEKVAAVFDRLRRDYPQRREIAACAIENWAEFDTAGQTLLRRLGFLF